MLRSSHAADACRYASESAPKQKALSAFLSGVGAGGVCIKPYFAWHGASVIASPGTGAAKAAFLV